MDLLKKLIEDAKAGDEVASAAFDSLMHGIEREADIAREGVETDELERLFAIAREIWSARYE